MSEALHTVSARAARRKEDQAEIDALDAELRALVKACATNGDLSDSGDEILLQLDRMPHLNARFRQKAAGWMLAEARNELRAAMARTAGVWVMPEAVAAANTGRVAARVSLYDWPLPGVDVRMGDATADDLEAAAMYHDARSASEQARSALYRQIGAMLKKAKKARVRDGVPETKLAEVMRGAQ